VNNVLLLGSCRYQKLFKDQNARVFPPRLHGTREMLFFLSNIRHFSDFAYEHLNLLFGDCLHDLVRPDFESFMRSRDTLLMGLDTLVLEICTKKACYDGNRPLSVNYRPSSGRTFPVMHLSEEELYSDLLAIQSIADKQFGIKRIIVLTHVNLPLRATGVVLAEREELVQTLIKCGASLNIDVINTARAFPGRFLEDVLPDGFHYTDEAASIVQSFLRNLVFKIPCGPAPLADSIETGAISGIEKACPAAEQFKVVSITAGCKAQTNTLCDRPLVPGRKAIYVRRSAGTGNQLFQWSCGVAIATALNADLYFDNDTGSVQHEQLIFNFTNICKTTAPPPGTPVIHWQGTPRPQKYDELMQRIRDWPDQVIITGDYRTSQYINRHEAAIRESLKIEPLSAYQDCIAVCVRRGDFLRFGFYVDLPSSWFEIAVENVRSRISRPISKVVVFSDDPTWCREALPWDTVSQDAWHDMRAIASCAGVVFTNSTFHWWGAWLANGPTVCIANSNFQHPDCFHHSRMVRMHSNGIVSFPVESGGRVARAMYGAGHWSIEVTNIINGLYRQGIRHIPASNEIAGDPAPNIVKMLELEFADGRKLQVPENGIADLSDYEDHVGR
jgi:hypothetical protein